MGKRVKRKTRAPPVKEKLVEIPSPQVVSEQTNHSVDPAVTNHRSTACSHFSKGFDISKLATKINSPAPVRCEDCREIVADKRTGKGKGKHGKKKGNASADSKAESKVIWVCLECGHYACGGVGLPTISQSHAVRHARQTRHPLAAKWENPLLCWCFPCTTVIPVEKTEVTGANKALLLEVQKLIKGRPSERSMVEVDGVWFGTGSIISEISEGCASNIVERSDGYMVRGLVNLGNTCFFNSVMQNLLAMDKLRDHLSNLESPYGPLTSSLKKLFAETKSETRSKHAINPKPFFGSVCSKAPQFMGYQQHDSHELLRCLLDGLCTEEVSASKNIKFSEAEENSSKPGPTLVDTLFGGKISSTVCCIECGHSSTVYEPFLDLSLPVPTKKSPVTKPTTSRTKKTKLPLKRDKKVRPKLNRYVEEVVGSSGDSTVKCSIGSVPQVSSQVQDFESRNDLDTATEGKTALVDEYTWLDYLEPEIVSVVHESALQNNDIETVRDSKDNDLFLNDVLTESKEVSLGKVNIQPDFSENPWEAEVPIQIIDSEVILLPYMQEISTAEASSSAVGYRQDESEFGYRQDESEFGFGDLFNEPEVEAQPIRESVSGNEVSETVGSSSESGLDEVDNADTIVSVESCLAHFIKPELLCDDNGWVCDHCSKNLQKHGVEEKLIKQSQSALKCLSNDSSCSDEVKFLANGDGNTGNGDNSTCNSVDAFPKSLVLCNGEIDCHNQNFGTIENGNNSGLNPIFLKCVEDTSEMKDAQTENLQESTSFQGATSNHESNESELKETNSIRVKVKKDATKRVFINNTPLILTVHLKRFTQDARGRLSKLQGHVSFKEILDLRSYMDPRAECKEEKCKYHLVGVVEHFGTMRGGHYVAYVRGEKRKVKTGMENGSYLWYNANDSHVHEVSLEQVLRSEAYILFFEKISE